MICYDIEQRSPEWFEARSGIPTASGMSALITPTGKPATGQKVETYLAKLVAERIETPLGSTFSGEWTDRGIDLEPDAISAYEFITENEVKPVGICYNDASFSASCSPDGLIGDDGGLEIKSLKLENHIKHLLAGKVPPDHIAQCWANIWVTGRDWWDFISYHPTVRPLIVRVERDDKIMSVFDSVVHDFCLRVDDAHRLIMA